MASGGMHEVDEQTFSGKVPGSSPTAVDREKFFKPNLTNKRISEHAIGIELTKTIQSVFQAAASDGLRVLHSPPHKVRGCLDQMSDAFNRVGIYLDNEPARRATTLSAADGAKKKLIREQVESGDFGHHSWHWMAVLGVVKGFHNPECAFDMGRAPSMSSDFIFEEDSDWLASDDDAEGVQPPSVPSAILDSMDDEDGSSDTSSDDSDSEPYTGRTGTKESAVSELADFMYNLATRQHRTFTYGFYVQWRRARLLYFDRTGILVSEPFDWTKPSSPLHDFVWKLAHMTPTELGYDPTAQQASFKDMVKVSQKAMDPLLSEAIRGYIHSAFFSTTEQHDPDEFPIYKLTVPTPDASPEEEFLDSERRLLPAVAQESQRAFLVGRPHFAAEEIIGQCTRGYITFDLQTERFCFLKDCWRTVVLGRTRQEHRVYERLHNRAVLRGVPTLVCGGDVGGLLQQPTRVRDCLPESLRPARRAHYRIVLREIGLPLTEFEDFGELTRIILDVIEAHYMAWNEADILHRDVSVGNILIDPITRNGYLIDWDESCLRSELENGPVEPYRVGTWQFNSALTLAFPRKPYRLSDDIESFVHVFRWLVLRFHRTELQDLRSFVHMEYECKARSGIPGILVGGDQKLRSFATSTSLFNVTCNKKLQRLLEKLAYNCFLHYRLIDVTLMRARYSVPRYTNPQATQELKPKPDRAPVARPPRPSDDDIKDVIAELMKGQPDSDDDDVWPEAPGQTAPPGTDACDVVGFLSDHAGLVNILMQAVDNHAPRQADQFRLRFCEQDF